MKKRATDSGEQGESRAEVIEEGIELQELQCVQVDMLELGLASS